MAFSNGVEKGGREEGGAVRTMSDERYTFWPPPPHQTPLSLLTGPLDLLTPQKGSTFLTFGGGWWWEVVGNGGKWWRGRRPTHVSQTCRWEMCIIHGKIAWARTCTLEQVSQLASISASVCLTVAGTPSLPRLPTHRLPSLLPSLPFIPSRPPSPSIPQRRGGGKSGRCERRLSLICFDPTLLLVKRILHTDAPTPYFPIPISGGGYGAASIRHPTLDTGVRITCMEYSVESVQGSPEHYEAMFPWCRPRVLVVFGGM